MAQTIRDVMTPEPHTVDAGTALADAATIMRDADIGDVIVLTDGTICGIVTDRDLVVRALADGQDPGQIRLREVCSPDLTTITADTDIDDAVRLMREAERAVREAEAAVADRRREVAGVRTAA